MYSPDLTWSELQLSACRSLLVFSAISMAACAGRSGSSRAEACALTESDSTYLALGRVYRDCAVDHRAQVVDRSAHADFQPRPQGLSSCYTAEIEFVVSASGVPEIEEAKVLRTNDPSFAQAALAAMARWRYKPADIDGLPVRQIVREKMKIGVVLVAVPAGQTPRPPTRGPVC